MKNLSLNPKSELEIRNKFKIRNAKLFRIWDFEFVSNLFRISDFPLTAQYATNDSAFIPHS
jgi:hypothetical protein